MALEAWLAWRDGEPEEAIALAAQAVELWEPRRRLYPYCLAFWPLVGSHLRPRAHRGSGRRRSGACWTRLSSTASRRPGGLGDGRFRCLGTRRPSWRAGCWRGQSSSLATLATREHQATATPEGDDAAPLAPTPPASRRRPGQNQAEAGDPIALITPTPDLDHWTTPNINVGPQCVQNLNQSNGALLGSRMLTSNATRQRSISTALTGRQATDQAAPVGYRFGRRQASSLSPARWMGPPERWGGTQLKVVPCRRRAT